MVIKIINFTVYSDSDWNENDSANSGERAQTLSFAGSLFTSLRELENHDRPTDTSDAQEKTTSKRSPSEP